MALKILRQDFYNSYEASFSSEVSGEVNAMQAFIFVDSAHSSAKFNHSFIALVDWSKPSFSRRYLTSPLSNFGTSNIIIQAFILFKNCISGDKRNCSMLLLVTHMGLGFISSYVNVSSCSSAYHMFISGRQVLWDIADENSNSSIGGKLHNNLLKRFSSSWQKIRFLGTITLIYIKAQGIILVNVVDSLHMFGRTALVDLDHLVHTDVA